MFTGEQDQLDRHQDDDDVLAVEEDAEHAEREQDRRDREIMADDRFEAMLRAPAPDLTLTDFDRRSPACARSAWAMLWRLTPALWRSVSTMAPIMATSSTSPATWK